MECCLAIKRISCHLWGHGWTLRNSANWSKSDKERLFSLHMLTYVWNLEKPNSQTRRAEWWLPCAGGAGNGELLIKRYPFPVTRWLSSGDLTYTTGAAASNSVSCTWKLLSEQILNVLPTHGEGSSVRRCWWELAVETNLQHTRLSTHHTVYFKSVQCYMSTAPNKAGKK